jgi:antitoxin component YwqK of YwqJK toxin-antitoxin module
MRSFSKWNGFRAAGFVGLASGCAAMLMLAAGCNREEAVATTQSTADRPAKEASTTDRKTAGPDTSSKYSDDQILAGLEKLDAPSGPAPIFEKYQDLTIQWDLPAAADAKVPDDDAAKLFKTPRSRQRYKVFSDGSKKKYGKYEEWYPNGQKFVEGEYIDDVKQGPWKLWHENGKLCKTENYLSGKLEGTWKTFTDKGLLESEVSFHDGVRSGRWVTYGPDGKTPAKQEEYYTAKEKKPAAEQTPAGAIDGEWIRYYADGKKASVEHFRNGKHDGELITYYPSGKPQLVQHFKDDQLNGKETRYMESGKVVKEIDWDRGQMVSTSNSGSAGK